MKFFLSLSIVIFLFLNTVVHGQTVEESSSGDEALITTTINNYFNGWLTGDTILISSAMHNTCHLKFVRDGQLVEMNKQRYLSNFKPRPRLENAEGRIITIDITRTAGSAKVELETPTRLFTDYFNLLKEGDVWYITDKVSTNVSK